jgi:hypothetical protein
MLGFSRPTRGGVAKPPHLNSPAKEMMIHPWYRSRLFWLGLPGLVFLLWAWVNSNFVRHTVFLRDSALNSTQGKLLWWGSDSDGTHDVLLDYRTGEVTVATIGPGELYMAGCVFLTTGDVDSEPVEPGEQSWFPVPRWQFVDLNAATWYRLIVLPYWLLTAGYAAILAFGLHRWQRRKLRLLTASSAGGAEPFAPPQHRTA